MTRTYAAKRLLEHGPLTLSEFRAITGWASAECRSALNHLMRAGIVKGINLGSKRVWRLA